MRGLLYSAGPAHQRLAVIAEGMTLLLHRPSGSTHILSSPAPEILEALEAGPADAATIVARLARRHDIGPPEQAEAVVCARLDELAAVGIVLRQ